MYHALLHGAVSPFQSFFSRFRQAKISAAHPVPVEHVYREILIETYDDTNLIDACGALDLNLKHILGLDRFDPLDPLFEWPTVQQERTIDVLEFLLSPQSNKRCLLTAASFIGQYHYLMNWRCTQD